jgi:hypothetical protein
MSLISLADLLAEMGVPMRDYRAVQMAVQKALLVPVRVPGGVETVFRVAQGAFAWTAHRVGGHRTGVVMVESFLPTGATHRDVVEMAAWEQILDWCPPLSDFPLGRLGRASAAVILVDIANRNLYLVDRDYFEIDVRHRLSEMFRHWRAQQEGR